MIKKVMFFMITVLAVVSTNVFATGLTLPDLGVKASDVIQSGVTEGGSVIGIGLAFAVGIMVVFFGYKMLKKVLKPA